MKHFEDYVKEGIVRTVTPDIERAESLQQEARRKLLNLKKNINKLGINEENANDYVEYCYNIILFLVRGEMYKKGYKSSGQGAHEAEVSFTKKLGFSREDTYFLNNLRYFRNGILYYGKQFDQEYAEKVIEFTKKIYNL